MAHTGQPGWPPPATGGWQPQRPPYAPPADPRYGPPPDPRYGPPPRVPSGLFPSGPTRPTYREPHPVRAVAVAAGVSAGAAWLLVFGLLADTLTGYAWWTLAAGAAAWLAAVVFARHGDRGVAAGLAVSVALGWSIAATAVAVRWASAGDWPLW